VAAYKRLILLWTIGEKSYVALKESEHKILI